MLKPVDYDHNLSLEYKCSCDMEFYVDLENAKLSHWQHICIGCKKVNKIKQIKGTNLGVSFVQQNKLSQPSMKPVYEKSLKVLLSQGYSKAVAIVAVKKASEKVKQETVTEIVKEALKEIR